MIFSIPWWALLIVIEGGLIFILYLFCSYISELNKLNRTVELMLRNGERVSCYYIVEDTETEEQLIVGEKFKSFSRIEIEQAGTFNLRGMEVHFIEKYKTVGDRLCLITYYVNLGSLQKRLNRILKRYGGRFVMANGRELNLR